MSLLLTLSFRSCAFLICHSLVVRRWGNSKIGIHSIGGHRCVRVVRVLTRGRVLFVFVISIVIVVLVAVLVISLVLVVIVVIPVVAVVSVVIPTTVTVTSTVATPVIISVVISVICCIIPARSPVILAIAITLPAPSRSFAAPSRAVHGMRGVEIVSVGFSEGKGG